MPEGTEIPSYAYKAFLSYSSVDLKTAAWLQLFLEHYRLPKSIADVAGPAAMVSRRLGKVFLDRSDARATDNLSEAIERELSRSAQLIVICSPEASSPDSWTSREIKAFRRLRPQGGVFAAIARGIPPACFPSALCGPNGEAPLAGDLRPASAGGKDGKRKAALKLLAALLGVDFDALWRRDVRRRRAQFAMWAAVALVLVGAILAGSFLVRQQSLAGGYMALAEEAMKQRQYDLSALAAANAAAIARGNPLMDASPATERLGYLRGIGQSTSLLVGHQRAVVTVRVDPSTREAFTAALDGSVYRWRTDDKGWSTFERLHKFLGAARRLDLVPSVHRLMMQSDAGRVVILDTRSGSRFEVPPPPADEVRVAALSGGDALLVAGMRSGALFAMDAPFANWKRVGALGSRVDGIAVHGGARVLAFDEAGAVVGLDFRTGQLRVLHAPGPEGHPLSDLSVSIDGSLVLESTQERVNLYAGKTYSKLAGYFTWKDLSVMSSVAGRSVAVSLMSGAALVLWETERGDFLKHLVAPGCSPFNAPESTCRPSIAIAVDGGANSNSRFVVGYWDGTIRVWSSAGDLEGELRGHTARVSDLVAYDDGRLLASASEDHTARLWKLSGPTKQKDVLGTYCQQTPKSMRDINSLLFVGSESSNAPRMSTSTLVSSLAASLPKLDPCE